MTEHNYLKTEKFKDLANELSKIKTDIELMRATSEMFPSMDQVGKDEVALHYYKAYQYMSLLFMKFQDIEEEKVQGERTDLTSGQSGHKLPAVEIAEQNNTSERTVRS